MRARIVAVLVCLVPAGANAAPGQGTFEDPIVVDAFPYAVRGDTAAASQHEIDSYGCAPAIDESGAEFVYRFSLDAPARVTAWVEGDGAGVDIDVHLLDEATVVAGVATACVARGDVVAEAELAAGTHYAIVDTYGGPAQSGPFVVHLEAIGDAWIERPVAEGVRWRARRYADGPDGPQVVHELLVDPLAPGLSMRALDAGGCSTVGALGAAVGAVAGVNGGYFGGGCAPLSLLKQSGVLVGTNGVTRGAFGLDVAAEPMVALVAAGADWPEAFEAHGGGPILVVDGVARAGSAAWAAEGISSAAFIGRNPRTMAGFDAAGTVHVFTVDGRRPNAAGMSLDVLAAFAASDDIGATQAVNLDGGGSTTMWIAGVTPNGVVNYPSDDPNQELASHPGSRPVSGGLYVFAAPFDHPPRFQTEPVASAVVGDEYAYDADAIDLDVDDVVTFSLGGGPADMICDPASGVVVWSPPIGSPAVVGVQLFAADGRGGVAEQTFAIIVDGAGPHGWGVGPPAEDGASAAAGDSSGQGAGCACRTGHEHPTGSGSSLGAWGLLAAVAARRRGFRRRRDAVARPRPG